MDKVEPTAGPKAVCQAVDGSPSTTAGPPAAGTPASRLLATATVASVGARPARTASGARGETRAVPVRRKLRSVGSVKLRTRAVSGSSRQRFMASIRSPREHDGERVVERGRAEVETERSVPARPRPPQGRPLRPRRSPLRPAPRTSLGVPRCRQPPRSQATRTAPVAARRPLLRRSMMPHRGWPCVPPPRCAGAPA